jgi:hypothetical protein
MRGFCQDGRSDANMALFVEAGQIHQHRVALPLLLKEPTLCMLLLRSALFYLKMKMDAK